MTTHSIRVLQVVARMDRGGIETWLMHVLRQIDRTKFHFSFCITGSDPGAYAPEIEALGGQLVPCTLNRRNPLSFGKRFLQVLDQGNYQVVHSHPYSFSGYVMRMAHRLEVPVRIAHGHTTSDGRRSSLPRRLYRVVMKRWIRRYATHGLAASTAAAASLFGSGWQSDSRFRVLHCGIDLEPFRQIVSRAEVRSEFGVPEDALVVGHVGRFTPSKNHAFLLRIAAEIVKHQPAMWFLLVGDGPLRPRVAEQARQLGIEGSVIFAGARSDVPRLMLGAMDVMVMPSAWEGLGLAVVEAQAAGLPSVVSDKIPHEAVVIPDAVIHLGSDAAPGDWARVVLETAKRSRISRDLALRRIAASDFTIERSGAELIRLYARAGGSE
jgi:glycosyltransferase involved in cell wall biosynthesis